jgi:hypothetical protein
MSPSCADVVDGKFLEIFDAGRQTNFQGDLEDAIACQLRPGAQGCGFEQPLEAMRRALNNDVSTGGGFLREGALLLVVFISDEDDCSAEDQSIYDASEDSPLGPLSTYRCFKDAVLCNDGQPDAPGERQLCGPRDDSVYLHSLAGYEADLRRWKRSDEVMVAVIAGDTAPVKVVRDGDVLGLDPSCWSQTGSAVPSIRLAGFADLFGGNGSWASICRADDYGLLTVASRARRTAARDTCLEAEVFDRDPDTDGVQAYCRATERKVLATGFVQESELPYCDSAQTRCFELVRDDACSQWPSSLRAEFRGEVEGAVRIECATSDPRI